MYASSAEQQRHNRVQVLADKLYRERYHYLLRIALKNAADSEDAAEAVQFAFLAFLGHYDPDGEAPPSPG
jgi:DNA-directed RNA polymerase specialized sigma24 family protein